MQYFPNLPQESTETKKQRGHHSKRVKSVEQYILPLSPTVNHYYKVRVVRGKAFLYIDPKVKRYREEVRLLTRLGKKYDEPVELRVVVYFADKRRQDLDNRIKGLQDALVKAGVLSDDSLIDKLIVEKGNIIKGGQMVVSIRPKNQTNQ